MMPLIKCALLIGALFVLLSRVAIAQDAVSSVQAFEPHGITVSGHAELKVKPDVAFVSFAVTTQSRDQVEAVKANAVRTTTVMNVLIKSGIANSDIETEFCTVSPDYDYNANPPVLTGYQVTNSIQVKIRDMAKAGLIFDKAIQMGATSADGLSFDLADKNRAQGEALVAAVANARSKADLIAGASGVELGRVISINESPTQPPPPIFAPRMAMAAAASAPQTPISPQEITISADVVATYAIIDVPK